MIISPAYAQTATGGDGGGLITLLPIILIFVVFYFLLIRPQQKKMKEHKAMVEAVRRGDRVVTSGGIVGTVTRISGDDELQVEIAEGVRVRVIRSTITTVLGKPEPAKGKVEEEEEELEEEEEDEEEEEVQSAEAEETEDQKSAR